MWCRWSRTGEALSSHKVQCDKSSYEVFAIIRDRKSTWGGGFPSTDRSGFCPGNWAEIEKHKAVHTETWKPSGLTLVTEGGQTAVRNVQLTLSWDIQGESYKDEQEGSTPTSTHGWMSEQIDIYLDTIHICIVPPMHSSICPPSAYTQSTHESISLPSSLPIHASTHLPIHPPTRGFMHVNIHSSTYSHKHIRPR